jgi:hypothetical protein
LDNIDGLLIINNKSQVVSNKIFIENLSNLAMMWQDFSGQKITQHLGTASHSPMGLDNRSLNVVSGGYRTPRYIQIFPALPLACFGNGGGGLTLFSGYGRSSPKVRYPNSYLFDSCCR